MFGYKRIVIGDHERGLHMKNKRFQGILGPGVHRYWDCLNRQAVEIFDTTQAEFTHPQWDALFQAHEAILADHLQRVELNAHQVGLLYKNDRLSGLLAPESRVAYWRGPVKVRVEVLDIAEDYRLPQTLAMQLVHGTFGNELGCTAANLIRFAVVAERHLGLLFVDGALVDTLEPGLHAFWRFNRDIKVEQVDGRVQSMEVQGQEILTKDKVSLRVNLSANYRVTDPVAAVKGLGNFSDHLYRALQFGLRQAIGGQTLDNLLGNKDALDKEVQGYAMAQIQDYGLQLEGVGIKDLILPGDMKDILNQVVEAEKVAQANVIKRREETAATRSLLNTARLMEENPTLLRLKELETLEKLTEKVGNLTVFGGLDGLMQDMVRIQVPTQGH
jgi:regulator of protease activity HflC (stomatin/prohibitin superfamily)